jgi:recombination protein RecT
MSENNNQPAPIKRIDLLKQTLEAQSVQDQFKNALQDNAGPFVASVIDLFNSDTYLQKCEPNLVIMEALKAAILKLPIIKSLGFAYIVPFKSNGVLVPQFQIGYKGLIQLAMRTNEYRIINADVVYDGEYRSRNKLTGEFDLSGEAKSEKIIGYFSYLEMKNGYSKTIFSTVEKVTAHAQKYSKSFHQENGPWKKEFNAMAIKTVLRGLLGKWGILSVEMLSVLDDDDITQQDTSEKVQGEINGHANKKPMGFSQFPEAEMVAEESTGGPGY